MAGPVAAWYYDNITQPLMTNFRHMVAGRGHYSPDNPAAETNRIMTTFVAPAAVVGQMGLSFGLLHKFYFGIPAVYATKYALPSVFAYAHSFKTVMQGMTSKAWLVSKNLAKVSPWLGLAVVAYETSQLFTKGRFLGFPVPGAEMFSDFTDDMVDMVVDFAKSSSSYIRKF